MTEPAVFHDELVASDAIGLADRFFDRFVFNMHPRDEAGIRRSSSDSAVIPPRDTADGFVVVCYR